MENGQIVAALFVEKGGCYYNVPGVDPWDKERDAREYKGPYPVVAHPPCNLWTRFAHVNYKRWGGDHNRPGNDEGCFLSALESVLEFGGVLEHPAFSDAWTAYGIPRPMGYNWLMMGRVWVCEVWQSAYGHKARKRTWLIYSGDAEPLPISNARPPGSHKIGQRNKRDIKPGKPSLSGKAASATPIEFRDYLISLARNVYV